MLAASLQMGGGSVNKLIVVCNHVIPRLAVIMEAASVQLDAKRDKCAHPVLAEEVRHSWCTRGKSGTHSVSSQGRVCAGVTMVVSWPRKCGGDRFRSSAAVVVSV